MPPNYSLPIEREEEIEKPLDPTNYTFKALDWDHPPSEDEIKWGPDPRWWMELFVKIPTQHGMRPFRLWPWMNQVASEGISDREFLYKSREIGSSTFWVAEKVRKCIYNPGSTLLIAAHKEDAAEALMTYAKSIIMNLPDGWRPPIKRSSATEMEFSMPTWKIKALPGTEDSGRSERGKYLIATEMAFWGVGGRCNPEAYWSAVTGSLVEGAEIVIESTANGVENRFHDMWYDKDNGYKRHFFPWQSNPTHDWAWYNTRRRDFLTKEGGSTYLFIQEYPTTPEEGFQGSTDTYFDAETITAGQATATTPKEIKNVGVEGGDPGYLKIWERSIPGEVYVIGADVAEGRMNSAEQPDRSYAYVMKWRNQQVVAAIDCRLTPDDFGKLLNTVGKLYNDATLGVERNGPGLATLTTLQYLSYPALFYELKETSTRKGTLRSKEAGFRTTQATKPVILNDLNIGLKTLSLTIPDETFWDQVKSFSRTTMSATGRAKDDAILAAAITLHVRKMYRHFHHAKKNIDVRSTSDRRVGYMPWSGQR